ncbi:tetratricopeptide repeat protein [Wenxinia saemankumensis]|uniref:Tetratricopeptide repeat-containing protein n=1 Tax=Wenxinia saemankumensis TaxID=1447782 RepID=A0A1M6CL50_9RHOB|nr:tetratricopeptide repeat protein [Wenxinia saemankumensis]SHI61448.1 Tetratricopeptide repeat-containing protein [Wenxinia saemankumensis]
MTFRIPSIKSAVTALAAATGFSAPLAAQDMLPEAAPTLPAPVPLPEDAPEAAPGDAAGAEARVDELLAQLAEAPEGLDARIVQRIFLEWSRSGSPTVDLLLSRGQDAMEAGDPVRAAEHFTAAIDYAPDFAEAYYGRATAYYTSGLIGPAIDDLRQTLVLNPRHFLAMQGFAVLLQELGREEDALELFSRVHEMHPANAEVTYMVEQLEQRFGGQPL